MKRARIDLRVRVEQKKAWEREADKLGLDLSELIRRRVEGVPPHPKRKAA